MIKRILKKIAEEELEDALANQSDQKFESDLSFGYLEDEDSLIKFHDQEDLMRDESSETSDEFKNLKFDRNVGL